MRTIKAQACTWRKGSPHILADLDTDAHLSTLEDDVAPDRHRMRSHLHRLIL